MLQKYHDKINNQKINYAKAFQKPQRLPAPLHSFSLAYTPNNTEKI